MILEAANGVHKDVDDLYGDQFTVTLARAAAALECAPYWHSGEKAPSRLMRAQELVRLSRVILQDDRLATVHGSTKAYDVTGFHCTCAQSQKGQSLWCVHAVAVKLARTMAEQGPRPAAPVALGTLRAGTLPLPPTTVDERLAHDPDEVSHIEAQRLATEAQGDVMDEHEYIPEPEMDDAPVTVLERPTPEPARVTAAVAAGHALLPSLDARTLEQSMQAYAAQRQVVTRYIKEQMTEGVDYYTLTIKGRVSKATLSKAGSEKFLSLFQLTAQFQQDLATWQMLGSKDGLLCYTCMLMTRSGEVIGEGRGARSVSQDGGDINKAIKMATKSAQVDAVLRTGALSDVFTQDLDDAPPEPVKPNPLHPAAELRQRIWRMVQAQADNVRTREDVEAWIQAETGYALHPDRYAEIITALEARA